MSTASKGLKLARSNNPGHTVSSVQFVPNGASALSSTSDPDGIATSIARTGTGTITITLKRRYKTIHSTAGAGGTAGSKATSTDTAGASVTNTIVVSTFVAGGSSAADLSAIPIKVTIHTYAR